MNDNGSVFSKGGGGTNFEQYIQTAFLTLLITRGNVPGIKDSAIIEMALQSSRFGYRTDDLFIRCISSIGEHKLVAQIKHEFSFTEKDKIFIDIISQLWYDFKDADLFDKHFDKLLIIKENLNKAEANNIKTLINWAKSKSSASDFFLEIKRIKRKEETINIFRKVIQEISGEKISDESLWEFFNCLELLAYDFGNFDSTHYSYYLNLIKLSKNSEYNISESEIWAQLLEYISLRNKEGGLINVKSISKEPFFEYFKLENLIPLQNSINKLKKESNILLNQFSNKIHGFHIDRIYLKQKIIDSIYNNRVTIITGNAGVGKSAIVRDVLTMEFVFSHLIVFRADQLNVPHLMNVFTNLGINHSIEDLLSCISIIPQKIVFIDSLEKLLEGDSENAFKQLYYLLANYPDIKIVATSRKYALDLIYLKYGIKDVDQPIEISNLDKSEIELVKERFPQLNKIFTNPKIKQLLATPKYIDFSITVLEKDNSDYSNITLLEFKRKLWNHIVENITDRKSGLPRKRSKAFSKIAIDRAKRMCLFVEPIDVDEEAIDKLESDNIIFRNGTNYMFSPSHDILEDWALIKYIDEISLKNYGPKDFFSYIGNEPAIRRGFRLWVEDLLIEDKEKIILLVKTTTDDNSIEKFWADEILIAIFRSENCDSFFSEFQSKFFEENQSFLKRCIHIIRTTCKESEDKTKSLIPTGSGWYSIIKLISENIEHLDVIRNLIINFLLEWEYKIYLKKELPTESIFVTKIITHYINQIENQDDYWHQFSHERKYTELINLLFNLLPTSKDTTSLLLNKILKNQKEDLNWQLREFYDAVIEKCLSGIYSRKISEEFPEEICEIAWNTWRYEKPKKRTGISEIFDFEDPFDLDVQFGIKEHLKDSPAGIFKTPFWNMLCSNTFVAFNFILKFINYCCDNYFKSKYGREDNVIEIELKVKNKLIKQVGSSVLWQAYRGTGKATPDVFRSLLISLEKYLLTIAGIKNETSRKLIEHYFFFLIEKSNNVAITSVLTSICIAYPEEFGNCILSILGVKEFYLWDRSRALMEHRSLSPMDFDISIAQKEMYDHNQLPHRTRYQNGLYDFIINYQLTIGVINSEIHKIFDDLKQNLENTDIYWEKALFEMDIRNWAISEYNKEIGKVIIQPKYQDKLKEFVDANQPQIDEQNIAASYSIWCFKKFKNEKEISNEFENWENVYNYIKSKKEFDYPASLAHIGLRDYKSNLSKEELDWCISSLVDAIAKIISFSWERYSFSKPDVNSMDREPSLKSFSLIFNCEIDYEDEKEISILLFYCLISPINEFEKKYLIKDFRENLWELKNERINRIWDLLVSYSTYSKSNEFKYYYEKDQIKFEEEREKEIEFISKHIDSSNKLNVNEINFETHKGNFLLLSALLIPFDTKIAEHFKFIKELIIKYFDIIFNDSPRNRKIETSLIRYEDQFELIKYLSKFLLIQETQESKALLCCILDKYYSYLNKPRNAEDIYSFIQRTLELTLCELDQILVGRNKFKNYSKEKFIKNFWNLWDSLNDKISNSGNLNFSSLLFLDICSNDYHSAGITWDENFKDWQPLSDRKEYYKKIIKEKGHYNIKAILNIFVSIGHTKLLPEGLNWLVDTLKQNPDKISEVINSKGEQFLINLFHYYCFQIKNDRLLLSNFIWLLDNMIDFGSSLAYLIRENVITYKLS